VDEERSIELREHAVAALPYLDEHSIEVAAAPDDVWASLLQTVERATSGPGAAYARVVGCDPVAAAGPRPLRAGSTIPGFRVVSLVPGCELVLAGRPRFSTYGLTFRIEPAGPGRSRLTAVTRAAFPGRAGAAYRTLVVGSGGHVFAVRRLLSAVQRLTRAPRRGTRPRA
jgi:hypothetical protein